MDKKRMRDGLIDATAGYQTQLDRLIEGYGRGVIDEDDYISQKNRLKSEIARLDERVAKLKTEDAEWLELTRDAFEFATYAHGAFLQGDAKTRREILLGLADWNCTISGKICSVEALPWYIPLQDFSSPLLSVFTALEPELQRTSRTESRFAPLSVAMRSGRDT